jgi:hypothetical protein
MDGVLKGIEGKSLSRKKLFDFLSDVDIEELIRKKIEKSPDVSLNGLIDDNEPKLVECSACMKIFSSDTSLKHHHYKNPACIKWISSPEKLEHISLDKGVHMVITDLLEKAVSKEGTLECKFCDSRFVSRSNLHKHFNSATICNQLAYYEFKNLINKL